MRAVCLLRKAIVISVRVSSTSKDQQHRHAWCLLLNSREREKEKPPAVSWLLLFVVMLPPFFFFFSHQCVCVCVQSIFNQPIYLAYAKIAQQQKNKMSQEAPSRLLLKLIRSMCDAIDDEHDDDDDSRCRYCCCRIHRHIGAYSYNLSLKRQHWLYTSSI